MKIESFDNYQYDDAVTQRALTYHRRYYFESLKSGQGIEEICSILRDFAPGGRWLDLGAGTTTLFWSICIDHLSHIVISDRYIEVLRLAKEFVESTEIPQCYRDMLDICGREENHIRAVRSLVDSYAIIDVFKPWDLGGEAIWDLITQFGCFGVAPNSGEYIHAVSQAYKFLAPNGRLIGVNWHRTHHYVQKHGGDNSYLSSHLIRQAAERLGARLLHNSFTKIIRDDDYDGAYIWVLEKTTV